MEMTRANMHGAGTSGAPATDAQGGLAAWLLSWFQTPLRVRFAGMGKPRAKRRMELVEMLQLGGKRQLMLVVCDGQRYLVGAGGDSVQSIAEMRAPLPASGLLQNNLSPNDISHSKREGMNTNGANAVWLGSNEEVRCCS